MDASPRLGAVVRGIHATKAASVLNIHVNQRFLGHQLSCTRFLFRLAHTPLQTVHNGSKLAQSLGMKSSPNQGHSSTSPPDFASCVKGAGK